MEREYQELSNQSSCKEETEDFTFVDDDHVRKFQKKCKAIANNCGHKKLGEDFAQWAVIKRLEGRKATAYFLFIDFLRETCGSTRSAVGRSKMQTFHWPFEIEYESSEDESLLAKNQKRDQVVAWQPSWEISAINAIDREKWLRKLKPKERRIIELLMEGFSQAEISRIFNCTESYISWVLRVDIRYKSSADQISLIEQNDH